MRDGGGDELAIAGPWLDDDGGRQPEGQIQLGQPVAGVQRLCVNQQHKLAPTEGAFFYSSCCRVLEVLQEDVVDHQQGTHLDGGEHARLEGQLHYFVGTGDLGQQDVATVLRYQSGIHD